MLKELIVIFLVMLTWSNIVFAPYNPRGEDIKLPENREEARKNLDDAKREKNEAENVKEKQKRKVMKEKSKKKE